MRCTAEFWDSLAPYHASIENSYLDLASLRRLLHRFQEPVLVVGAGQGLIVAELRKHGLRCDGIDSSAEMIRYARIRRGLELIEADARALPFAAESYQTIIHATGVVDFMSDDEDIRLIMREARRVLTRSGSIYVAFYRLSAASEQFMVSLALLRDNVILHREAMRIHQLKPHQTIAWVAGRTKFSYCRSFVVSVRAWVLSTWQEKRNAFHMHRILAGKHAGKFIKAVPETQPYRNGEEIRKLFLRLAIPIKQMHAFDSCFIVEICRDGTAWPGGGPSK